MSKEFRLLMISAMYENGGNVTQRLLDGHPELISSPFESQPGTRAVQDHLSSLYPAKYRWPVFPLEGSAEEDYESIIDEECKVRVKTPSASKFRDWPICLDDSHRRRLFMKMMAGRPRTRPALVESFFRATAQAWTDRRFSEKESVYVGYSPIVGVDADKIIQDFSTAHVINVVRNPWSAYADTKKRPVPLSLSHYLTGWSVHLQHALAFAERYPGQVHLLRYEDILHDPVGSLSKILQTQGVGPSSALARPSWNGTPLKQMPPWGTIATPTLGANDEARAELSPAEEEEIRIRTRPFLSIMGYK